MFTEEITPGDSPSYSENPPFSEADLTDSGGGQSLLITHYTPKRQQETELAIEKSSIKKENKELWAKIKEIEFLYIELKKGSSHLEGKMTS